jgi:hypothetical protein
VSPRIGRLVVSILASLVGVGLVVAAAFVEGKADGFVLLNLGLLCIWLGVLGGGGGG